ncbi:MAG: beta strand repeat-containing protein [Candidatus Levyibacteriota bacterium]
MLTVSSGGASITGGLNNNSGGITNAGAISGATNITASGTISGAILNATSTLELNGTDINTAGTLTDVAYKDQNNNFTVGQTIAGLLTVSSGGASITGGLNNNSGGITNAGAISGATTIAANNTVTLSSAAPLTLSSASPVLTLATTGNNGTLTIKDAEASPNTLLTLVDNGTSGTLSVANINATNALQLNGTSINTTGTLTNVAYKGQDNNFTVGQTIGGTLTVSTGGASISGGIDNNNGGITNTGAIAGATNITASGTVQGATVNATTAIQLNGANINTGGTLSNVAYLDQANSFTNSNTFSNANPLVLSNTTPNITLATAGNNGTLTIKDAEASPNTLLTLVDNGSNGTLSVANLNGTSAIQLNGTSINTTGTLTNVAYKGQDNNFTVGQTIGGTLTVSSGGASISGGLNNNSGGITNAGSVAGVTTLNASGVVTLSSATPLSLTSSTPAITLGTGGANGTLTIKDSAGVPNTLLTLQDTGTAATLTVGTINASSTLELNGTDINTAGTLTNVAYLNASNTFTAGQTISTGGLTIQAGGANITDGIDNNSGGIINTGSITGATNITASGTIQGATLNGTGAIQLNGASINTTGTLTNVAYKGQNNNFTVGQTIGGLLTVSSGGASISGGIDNNSGGITNTGSIAGATTIAASGVVTLSSATPLSLTSSTPSITVGTGGANGTLSFKDSAGAPNTLMTLTDNGTTGTLAVANVNATSALQLNGTDINTTGTLSNVAYKGQNNNFTTGQTIGGLLTVSSGGASITGGIDNNSGGITNTGAISGATTVTASGTIQGATLNATSTLELGGIDINTTGTLTNVAYKGQDNNFTTGQTVGGTVTISGASTDITTGTNEDLTLAPNGSGQIVLSNLTQVPTLGAAGTSILCRNGSNQISSCSSSAFNETLQQAYDAGNTITTTTGRNIAFTLYNQASDAGVATSFSLTNAGTAKSFIINDTNAATNTALSIQSGGVDKLTINENGVLSTSGNISTTGTGTITSAGALTVSGGGASITGGIDNTTGGITNTGAIAGATTIAASGTVTLSSAAPLAFSNTLPIITLGAGGANGTLTIKDSAGVPNTLLTLQDTGTAATLTVDTINASSTLQLNGTDINTAGTLSDVAYKDQNNNFSVGQTIGGLLTVSSGGASITGGIDNNSGGITNTGSIAGATTITASGTIQGATLNGTGAIQLNGTSINTTGTLTNVAYKGQNNNFTVGQTIGGALTVSSGGASINGGLNNNSGGITNAGAISGATTIAANNTVTLSGASPLAITNATPTVVLGTAGVNSVLTVEDAEASPNTLMTLTDNGTDATLAVANINATSALEYNGTDINTTGTLTNVAYKGQDNNFTVGQTIGGTLTVSSGGASITGGFNNNNGNITNAGAISGATTIAASGTVTLSGATPLALSATSPTVTFGAANSNGTLSIKDTNTPTANTLLTLVDNGTNGTLSVANINATTALQLNGTSINTAGTLSNVAYLNASNNFTAAQTISSGGLTISAGGLSVTGNINNNSGSITNAGAISGATTIAANSTVTLSGATPLALSNAAPAITLATAGTNGTLTITDAEASPNTLLTLTDNGTDGTLTVANINATSALEIGGANINTAGTLTNVAYKNATNNFTAAQTISAGGLSITAGGASIAGGLDNNNGGITNAGAISGATSVTASGTIQGATVNATGTLQLNGTNINTNGTLTNVAYKGQDNNFTVGQTIGGLLTVSTGGASISGGLNNNNGGITNAGAISGATTIAANNTVTLSGATPLAVTNAASTFTVGAAGVDSTLTFKDGDANALMTLTDAGTTGNLSVTGNINATTALQVNGANINTTGTLTNVAYKGQNNNFTVGQTIGGALTVSSGGASISGGLNNNSGNITNAGSIAGVTTLNASGLATLSGGNPLALTNSAPNITLATAGVDGTLTIKDAEASPNTLLTLQDTGTAGNLTVTGIINGVGGLQINGANLNTAGTLSNVAYLNQANVFSLGQTISTGGLTISAGGATITGGIDNNSGGITNTGSIAGATTITASGTIQGANVNATSALQVGGTDINTTGTLTNVAYKGQNNNFTVGQTIGGATTISSGGLTVSAGGASISGGLNNNSGNITNAGSIAGATTINASGLATLSSATPLAITNSAPVVTLGVASVDSTLTVKDGDANTLLTLTDAGTTGDLSVTGNINATSSLQVGGANINTTGTLTNVAYKGQNNNFTVGQTIGGLLTVSSGGASITGGLNNNSGNITNAGSIAGVTTINASGLATFSSGTPLALTSNTPSISLATAGNNGTLTIKDAEASPNTLLTLTDNGTTGTLTVDTINGTTALQVGGANINTTGTLTNVAYKGQNNNFTVGQTIGGALTVSSGGASITGGLNNNSGNITNVGSLAGVTTVNASGLITLSSGTPIAFTSNTPTLSMATAGNNGTLTIQDAEAVPNTLLTLVDNGTTGTLSVDTINALTALQVGGANINTTGTLTNVAYKGQNNNFTVGQTIGGATTISSGGLTVSAGGASITGGLNNNSGNITNAGTISGATGITSSGTINFSGIAAGTATHGVCIDGSSNLVQCDGLQSAYALGNTITTTSGRDIAFTLAGSLGVSTSFSLTNAGTAPAFIINDNNGATNTSFEIQSGAVNQLTINENGVIAAVGGATPALTTLAGGSNLTVQPATNTNNTQTGGTLNLYGGTESGTGSTGGSVNIDAGNGTTGGNINIGATYVSTFNLGRSGLTTNNLGSLTSTQTLTASNGFTMTTGALSLTSTSGTINSTGLTSATMTSSGTFAINGAPVNINTSTGNTTIGNATSGSALAFNSGANASQTFTSLVTNGTGTSSAFVFNASALTSGTAMYVGSSNVTTGTLLNVDSNSITSGSELSLTQATSTFTGNLGQINLGNGSGTALNITNAGSGYSLRVNDDGTFTDSSPFMIDASGNVGIGTTAASDKLVIGAGNNYGLNMGVPGTPSFGVGGGGSLNGTYFYKITALDVQGGESTPSTESSQTVGAGSSITVSWSAVTNATSYRIYRGTSSNGENTYFTSSTNSYVDTGTGGTGGSVPTTNTAFASRFMSNGSAYIQGSLNLGYAAISSSATAARTLTIPDASGTFCISGDTCATSGIVGYLQRNLGALAPANITDDFLLGGTSTSSARFSFINNIGSGTPTFTLGINGTSNGTISLGTSGAFSNPTLSSDGAGGVTLQASGGTTTIGSGNGTINIVPSSTNPVTVSLGVSGATGDFIVQNNGTAFATFNQPGNIVFNAPSSLTTGTLLSVGKTSSSLTGALTGLSIAPAINNTNSNAVTGLNVDISTISTRGTSSIASITSSAFTGGGTGASNYGINVGAVTGTSTSTNYGVYIDDVSGGSNSYGEYINNTSDSFGQYINHTGTALSTSGNTMLSVRSSTADTSNHLVDIENTGTSANYGNTTTDSGIVKILNASTSTIGTTTTNPNVAGLFVSTADSDTLSTLIRNTAGSITMQNVGTSGAQGDPGVLTVEGNTGSSTTYNLITAYNSNTRSDAAAVFRVRADGNIYGEAAFNATGADYAEYFPSTDSSITAGEVVTADSNDPATASIKRSASAYDNKILGVISSNPAFIGNAHSESDPNAKLVSLQGQVSTSVNNENGIIHKGDYLTTSSTAGVAMKASKPGLMVGRALEDFTGTTGTISVLVSVAFADPNDALSHMILDNSGSLVSDTSLKVNGNLAATTGAFGSTGQLTIDASGSISTSASVSAQLLSVGTGTITSDTNGNVINTLAQDTNTGGDKTKFLFRNSLGTDIFALDSAGNATISGTLTTSGGTYDLAEDYPTKDPNVEAGDVVAVDPRNAGYVLKSTRASDKTVLGIYSEKPGFILSEKGNLISGDKAIPVALTGRVPVKVNLENGVIHKGDFLTASSTPGVAMKAVKPGQIVGSALEDFTSGTTGKVMAFVNVSYADPSNALSNLALDDTGKLIISDVDSNKVVLPANLAINGREMNGTLSDGLLAITHSIDSVQAQVNTLQDNVLAVAAKAETIETKVATLEQKTNANTAQIAAVEGIAKKAETNTNSFADRITSATSDIAKLNSQIQDFLSSYGSRNASSSAGLNLTPAETIMASDSASMNTTTMASTATLPASLTSADSLTIDHDLKALGNTYLGDTTVAGAITVNSELAISRNAINVAGTPVTDETAPTDGILYLQSSPLANQVNIFNGNVTISRNGTIEAKGDLKVAGNLSVSGAITISAIAGEDINAGDVLYVAADGIVKKADATDSAKTTAIGVATESAKINHTVDIAVGGKASGFKNLEAGRKYLLGPKGILTTQAPVNAVKVVPVGVAFSDTQLLIQPQNNQ